MWLHRSAMTAKTNVVTVAVMRYAVVPVRWDGGQGVVCDRPQANRYEGQHEEPPQHQVHDKPGDTHESQGGNPWPRQRDEKIRPGGGKHQEQTP